MDKLQKVLNEVERLQNELITEKNKVMKANELMVDDWVYNKNINKPMQIYPTIFPQMFRRTPNANTEDYNIFPIPLTAEILEKNGFKKQREGRFLLEASEDNYWVKFYPKDTNYTRGAYSYIDIVCGCISISEMPIEFLHQLQHALRLCGIEKTIKL